MQIYAQTVKSVARQLITFITFELARVTTNPASIQPHVRAKVTASNSLYQNDLYRVRWDTVELYSLTLLTHAELAVSSPAMAETITSTHHRATIIRAKAWTALDHLIVTTSSADGLHRSWAAQSTAGAASRRHFHVGGDRWRRRLSRRRLQLDAFLLPVVAVEVARQLGIHVACVNHGSGCRHHLLSQNAATEYSQTTVEQWTY